MIVNNNFIQSIANILQIKIIKPQNIETTALGAAYLAGLNSGLIKDIKMISKLWKSSKIYKPKIKKLNDWKFYCNRRHFKYPTDCK